MAGRPFKTVMGLGEFDDGGLRRTAATAVKPPCVVAEATEAA
jgi:hypothetical protein